MQPQNLILRAPQHPMVDFLSSNARCSLWAGMGIGKTTAGLFALEMMRIMGTLNSGAPTLVCAPMRVARDTWKEDAAKWTQFKDLEITPIVGTPRQRMDILKLDRPIFTTSYENLPWLVDQWLERWPYRQVIADESDRLKGFRAKQGGMRARSIGRVAHTLVRQWWNFTGTPSPNGLKDLWGQQWFVDRGARLGASYSAFSRRWFMLNWNGHGIAPLPFAKDQIHAVLSDVCLTVDPKDYFDLEDPTVIPVKVKLPKDARRIYKELEDAMFAEFAEGNAQDTLEVFNAAALTNKCLQLANGAVYTEYPTWRAIHDEKIEALKSIQAESGGVPLFVAYAFKSDKERLLKAFSGAVDLATKEGLATFKAGHAPLGIAHPKSMGHGIDGLQTVTNILVRFGHDWNLGERMQMLERIGPMRQMQAGLERPVIVYDIIAEDTMDVDCIAAHAAKRSVQDALLAAMKRRK